MTTASAALLTVGTAVAWNSNLTENLMLSSQTRSDKASEVYVKPTTDGKIWMSWAEWGTDKTGEFTFNRNIYVQLLDREGNKLLDPDGVCVSNTVTPTWTGGYGMDVDSEGNIYIVHSDSGEDTSRVAFVPRAYKLDQEGNMLWGLNGVELPTTEHYALRPKVCVSNSGVVMVGYHDLWNNNQKSQMSFMRINDDGTLAWPETLNLPGMYLTLTPCGDSDYYLNYAYGGGIALHRLTPDGDFEWTQQVTNSANLRSEVPTYPDGHGGILMHWGRQEGNNQIYYNHIQRVSEDGELFMGLDGVDLDLTPAAHSEAGFAIDSEREVIYAYWTYTSVGYAYHVMMKTDFYGDLLWDEMKQINSNYIFGWGNVEGHVLDDGSFIMVYGENTQYNDVILHIERRDSDGEPIWQETIGTEDNNSKPKSIWLADQGLHFFSSDRGMDATAAEGRIWGQNVYYEDGHGGASGIRAIETEASTDSLNLTFADGSLIADFDGTVTLYNVDGRVAAMVEVTAGTPVALGVEPGMYVAKAVSGETTRTSKIAI